MLPRDDYAMMSFNLSTEIIHIEDDTDWRDEIQDYIRRNCDVDIASYTSSTSVDALRRISSLDGPCIIIVDLRLGDDSAAYGGYFWLLEELEAFVGKNPQTEVFVLSGQLNEGIVASLARRGIQRKYIFDKAKWPESRERFVEAIQDSSYRLTQGITTMFLGKGKTVEPKPVGEGIADMISILFLAADPTDASRLRLGEELREIQEKLQLAKLREQFQLHQRMSVRPADISQALLDINPGIVHFSGHGMATGALCFENQTGETLAIQPDALAALFEQFANQVNCVVLNACYSEIQSRAISNHIDYVIGMNQAIGDKAAITFAIGFYQALGAGRTTEEAYKLGCIQIRLHGIPEHLTPVLIKKGHSQI